VRTTMPILTATHDGEGIWKFECPLHDDPLITRSVSSPRHAPTILKGHMDTKHPGMSVWLKVSSQHSGIHKTKYTAPDNVTRTL
jgi:hypothetical protein